MMSASNAPLPMSGTRACAFERAERGCSAGAAAACRRDAAQAGAAMPRAWCVAARALQEASSTFIDTRISVPYVIVIYLDNQPLQNRLRSRNLHGCECQLIHLSMYGSRRLAYEVRSGSVASNDRFRPEKFRQDT
eukprot:6198358-Pleurochrysis_carterae.AAC.3